MNLYALKIRILRVNLEEDIAVSYFIQILSLIKFKYLKIGIRQTNFPVNKLCNIELHKFNSIACTLRNFKQPLYLH